MEYIKKCELCESNDFATILTTRDYISRFVFRLVRCKQCGLVFVNPRPLVEDLHGFYPPTYYSYTEKPSLMEVVDALIRIKKLQNLKKMRVSRRILDIGCGKGLTLEGLRKKGWEVYGTELSEGSAKFARENLRLNVISKDLTDCRFPCEFFDVITLWHVLEHLPHPGSQLVEIHKRLKNDGILVIQVPDFGSPQQKLFEEKWFHLDVPRHLYHFEDNSLTKLLDITGYRVVKKKYAYIPYDLFGVFQSSLNLICKHLNFFNDIVTCRKSLNDIMKSRDGRLIWDTIISFSLSPITMVNSVFILLFSSLVYRKCGTLEFYAVKK